MNGAVLSVLLGSFAWTAFAQPQNAEPSSVPEVQLTLRCPVSPCRFRQGEVIMVDLVFTARADGYGVLARYPDRFESGDLDLFFVRPTMWTGDPLAGSRIVAAGSYNPTPRPLSTSAPIVLSMELNQWIRFDKPGDYQLTALTRRVSPYMLKSDPLEIQIVPADPKWQAEQLAKVRRDLPANAMIESEAQRAAVRALAYLGSGDALREIRRLLPAGGWPYPKEFLDRNASYLFDRELARLELLRRLLIQ